MSVVFMDVVTYLNYIDLLLDVIVKVWLGIQGWQHTFIANHACKYKFRYQTKL